jgi:hypothetical protein
MSTPPASNCSASDPDRGADMSSPVIITVAITGAVPRKKDSPAVSALRDRRRPSRRDLGRGRDGALPVGGQSLVPGDWRPRPHRPGGQPEDRQRPSGREQRRAGRQGGGSVRKLWPARRQACRGQADPWAAGRSLSFGSIGAWYLAQRSAPHCSLPRGLALDQVESEVHDLRGGRATVDLLQQKVGRTPAHFHPR